MSRTTTALATALLSGLSLAALPAHAGGPAGTTVTYQGKVLENGAPAGGALNCEFRLFSAEVAGTQVGSTVITTETVTDGIVTAELDFGVDPSTSAQPLWLEVVIEGETLTRQQLTSAPFSLATRGIDVAANGNVGIGTTDPQADIDINGTLRLGLIAGTQRGIFTQSPNNYLKFVSNNDVQLACQSFLRLQTGPFNTDRAVITNDSFTITNDLIAEADLNVAGSASVSDNVGINGNVDPAISLTVHGGLRARAGGPGLNGVSNNGYSFVQNTGGDNDSGMFSTGDGNVELWTNNAPRLTIGPSGNVSISATLGATLDVNGMIFGQTLRAVSVDGDAWQIATQNETRRMRFRHFPAGGGSFEAMSILDNGNVGIGTTNPGFLFEVDGSAGKPGGGSWSVASDARLKTNVEDLHGALDTLLSLRGVTFEYKDPKAINELPGTRVGFIAQEVETVIPDWVAERTDGYKALTIRGFEALAVEAMRELQAENDELRDRLATLETMVERLAADR